MRFPYWVRGAWCVVALTGCSGTTDANGALAPFGYDRSQPLDVQQSGFTGSSTAKLDVISYNSPAGGRVSGTLGYPLADTGVYAGIVMLPAVGQSAVQAQTQEGLEMAYRNAVVLAIDAPYVRRGGPVLQFLPSDSAEQVQLIQELQRAVDVLVTRGDVDPNRIAFIGLGYGGTMGALLAGVETRIKAYALAVPDAGWVAHYTSGTDTLAPLDTMPSARRAAWFAAMTPLEPLLFVHRSPPAALLIQSAQNDEQLDSDDVADLHNAAPAPHTILWYPGLHALPAQAKIDRQAFLASRVGTDP